MIKNAIIWKHIKWFKINVKHYTTAIAENHQKGKNKYKQEARKVKIKTEDSKKENEKTENDKKEKKKTAKNIPKIEDIKNEKELELFYRFYNEKKLDNLFKDYQNIINNDSIKNKCSKKEVEECAKISKYVTNVTLLAHFLKKKKNNIKENNIEYKPMTNNIYYIHNIEKVKINEEEIIAKNKDGNLCLNYFLENNIYKLIYKLKKCDLWNYREKTICKSYVDYYLLFPLTYSHVEKNNNNFYTCDYNIFFNVIHKNNKNVFIEIVKKTNYKILNPGEINNLLISLTVLHHNNKSFCKDKTNILEHGKKTEVIEFRKKKEKVEQQQQIEIEQKQIEQKQIEQKKIEQNEMKEKQKYKNSLHSDITNYHSEYIQKKIFIDIFNNIYKHIYTKVNNISFLYLYDYILLMSINEIKNREAYTNVINVLSNYINIINKMSNQVNSENEEIVRSNEMSICEDGLYSDIENGKREENNEKICKINSEKKYERNKENEFAEEKIEENQFIMKTTEETKEQNETLNDLNRNDIIYENENFQLKRSSYQYIKTNLYKIKNIILSKILLIYIMKYVYSHIDNNILYSHSDIICENLELLHQHLITNFIFTIGTCKHIDEFCMFMLAKFVQNNIETYLPNDITIIVNTYADASLEDVSFYETICSYIKNNFYKFLATDIIKIIYAFSKVRIRDENLLKMAYQRINNYIEDREKKYSYSSLDDIYKNTQIINEKNENKLKMFLKNDKHKGKYIINKYLCGYAIIAAGKLDFYEGLNKLFYYLKKSIIIDGIDIRGMLWMPITLTNCLSFECIYHFLPVYINLIYNAFKRTVSSKLMTLIIRRHNILLHAIETNIIPKKYIDQNTLKKLYFICKSKKDTLKEKVFVPDSSTFHIEVSNALLSLDIPHQKEVNIYPFTIDIFIQTAETSEMLHLEEKNDQMSEIEQIALVKNIGKLDKKKTLKEDTYFQETFETKHVKNKVKNKNEVYTDIPFT